MGKKSLPFVLPVRERTHLHLPMYTIPYTYLSTILLSLVCMSTILFS